MEIEANLRTQMARFVRLTDDEFQHIYQAAKVVQISKGEVLFREGERCDYLYFVGEGLLKYFYMVDGEERIGQFFFENAWAVDLYSFLSREVSKMNMGAIENSTLLAWSYDTVQQLYEDCPKFERFGRLMVEHTFVSSQQRSASFLTLSHAERYELIVQTRPKVIARVPQYMIAAYLGIKPESLSRIRKKNRDK